MRFSFTILTSIALSCVRPSEQATVALVSTIPCEGAAAAAGVVPDDGMDDRAAMQVALNACAGGKLRLPAGEIDIDTPPVPRPVAMLTVPSGTSVDGMGDSTLVRFRGDNGRKDWRGFQLLTGIPATTDQPARPTGLHRMRWESSFVAGSTVEQTHIASVYGPTTGHHVSHISCSHPQNGSKSGDCIQLVCYPPSPGQPDKRCWDIEIDHVRFEQSGRSGIAFHSGVHGTVDPDTGHMTTRFHHNVCGEISDQCIDGEGSGDTDGIEIDHNVALYTAHESALVIQIQASRRVWIHDNVLAGRGMELLGCDECRLSDNRVTQSMPGDGSFPVRLRNVSGHVVFSDETYEREAAAAPGPVVAISVKDAAPHDITIQDTKLIQRTAGPSVAAVGIQGLAIRHTSIEYTGPARQADAIQAIGSGSAGCPSGVRADRTELSDVVVTGPLRAVLFTTGSYCGAGSFDVQRTASAGPQRGLLCENVSTGARVLGPVVYQDNTMPAPSCAGLVP